MARASSARGSRERLESGVLHDRDGHLEKERLVLDHENGCGGSFHVVHLDTFAAGSSRTADSSGGRAFRRAPEALRRVILGRPIFAACSVVNSTAALFRGPWKTRQSVPMGNAHSMQSLREYKTLTATRRAPRPLALQAKR